MVAGKSILTLLCLPTVSGNSYRFFSERSNFVARGGMNVGSFYFIYSNEYPRYFKEIVFHLLK